METKQDTSTNSKMLSEYPKVSNTNLVKMIIKQWKNSTVIKDMKMANEYYLVRNEKIQNKKREYKDQTGATHINETLSNIQIPSAFLRKNVNKKVNYAFGKQFTLNVENVNLTKEQQQNDMPGELYLKEWQYFCGIYFIKTLKRLGKNAINNGIGWGYVWIDETNNLKLVDVESETIYPIWGDRPHTQLKGVVRDYWVNGYMSDGSSKLLNKVEYWAENTIDRYIYDAGNLEEDNPESETIDSNLQDIIELPENAIGWEKVPFISLKANEDEMPMLNSIKACIDAYDELQSKSVDTLIDDIDPILVLKNISAEVGGLIKTRELIKQCRIASIDTDGGDAKYLSINSDITSLQQKLEHLKRDIREFGDDIDTQDIKFGSNPSGVALKAMYQDLDTYIDGLEIEFQVFIENLKYFFDKWLENKKVGSFEQWQQYKVIVKLNRDMMINESALIEETVKLVNTGVSQETIDNYNPAVETHEIEQARRDAEEEIALEKQKKANELFNFQEQLQQDTKESIEKGETE